MTTVIEPTQLKPGMTVKVHQKVKEGGKERIQIFEGLILGRMHGTRETATFTIRKVSEGIGVERIFPMYSPVIAKIELLREAKIRRAKLYHMTGKTARPLREKKKIK